MRVITRRRLAQFWAEHPDAERPLTTWFQMARSSTWRHAADVQAALPNVSVLENNRFVFRIRGNNYRLVAKLNFKRSIVYVRFVGTHAAYDEIDANTV
jgi:mRNA interferase HigB